MDDSSRYHDDESRCWRCIETKLESRPVSRFQSRNVAYHELDPTRVTINEEYARGETMQRARPDIIYRVKLTPGGGRGGQLPRSIVFSIQMLNVKMTFTISRKWNGPRCRLGGHLRGCSSAIEGIHGSGTTRQEGSIRLKRNRCSNYISMPRRLLALVRHPVISRHRSFITLVSSKPIQTQIDNLYNSS